MATDVSKNIIINGDLAYDTNATTYGMESIVLNFDSISEVKIIVSGNAKLWDVSISKLKYMWQ